MHEMSLAASIMAIVDTAAARDTFARVTVLELEIGALACVEQSALRFALGVMARDTCLEQARIDIVTSPGQAWCVPCGTTIAISAYGAVCPHCGNQQLHPTSGTELRVTGITVED